MRIKRGWFFVLMAGSLMLPLARAAESHWIQMRSSDFEVYSTASEKSTRDTLHQFEQVRGFFSEAMNADVAKSAAVRIVVFGSKKEYDLYRPNDFAAAYYLPAADR